MKKVILSIIVTIVLLYILLSTITYGDISKLFNTIPSIWILAVWGIYFIYLQLIRLRFSMLMHSQKIGLWNLFSIITIHNFYNRLLPLKTGEISYVYMLKHQHGLPAAEGAATLIIARIFDYVTVSFMFVISSLLLINKTPPYVATVTIIISVLLLVSVAFLFSIATIGLRVLNLTEKIFAKVGLNRFSVTSLILNKIRELVDSFQTISQAKTYLNTFLLSLSIWGCMFFMHYWLLKGMGLHIDVLKVIIGSTFCIFTNILPLHGIAGLGTYETGWTIGYLMVGFNQEVAISSAFIAHMFFLFTGVTYGFIGFVIYQLQTRKHRKAITPPLP